jgi:hypothetical protein
MPVGYMQGSKRARNTPSIANQTSIFGIMGGLAPRVGLSDTAVYRHQIIKGSRGDPWQFLPQYYRNPTAQQNYMRQNLILSVNPLASGGVGKKVLLYGGSRTGSAPQG